MTGFFLAALIAVPVAGVLAVPARWVTLLHRWLQETVALWLAATFCWLGLTALGRVSSIEPCGLVTLIDLGADDGAVALSLELSNVRVGLLLSGLLLLLPAVLSEMPDAGSNQLPRSSERSLRLQLGILFAGAIALLSDDLFVVATAWLLLDSLLIHFVETGSGSLAVGASELGVLATDRRFLLSLLRLSSVALMAAVLLAATRYHSTSLSELVVMALTDFRIDAGMMRGGILIWFALSVACRAALFPAGIWMRPLAESDDREMLPIVALAAILPAVGVWLSLNALLATAQESSLLLAVLGGLSCVTSGAIAIGARTTDGNRQSLPLLAVSGAFALMLVSVPVLAESVDAPSGPFVSMLMLLSNTVAIGVLSLSGSRRGASLLAAGFLLCGIGGPNLLLDQLHSLRQSLPLSGSTNALAVETTPVLSGSLLTGLWWAVCVSQFLIGMAVANRLLRGPVAEPAASETRTVSKFASPVMLALACIGGLALAASDEVVFASDPAGIFEATRMCANAASAAFGRLISFNAATPSGLLGAVCVWLFLRLPDEAQGRIRGNSASLERLARNWFYVGTVVAFLRVVVGWVAFSVELLDRQLLGGEREDAWRANATRVGRTIEEVGEHGGGYPSLAALLAVVGVLLALAGPGR